MRIAYLTNAYPKVSHSFIRREIAALERLGVEVTRISIRPTRELLPDPADDAELARTTVLMDGPGALAGLMRATAIAAIVRPTRLFLAMRAALAMACTGGPGLVRNLAYLAQACRLAEILNRQGITHVHAHFGTNPAAVARLAWLLTGIPFSVTVHGPDEFDSPRGLSLRQKIADARFTAGVSSFGRSQLMRWANIADWPRLIVVHCGVDRAFLDHQPPPVADSNRLVCVARLSAQKGLPLLIDAAAQLASSGPLFELRIVGDGELRTELERQIADLGLQDNVTLLGWCSGEEIRAELSATRAFVLPSFAEGLPVVLMEAMALARPVITTAIAGIPELVDSSCGWVVPAGSVDALAAAMREALEAEPEQLAMLGKEGRRRVIERHDIGRNAAVLLEHFRSSTLKLQA